MVLPLHQFKGVRLLVAGDGVHGRRIRVPLCGGPGRSAKQFQLFLSPVQKPLHFASSFVLAVKTPRGFDLAPRSKWLVQITFNVNQPVNVTEVIRKAHKRIKFVLRPRKVGVVLSHLRLILLRYGLSKPFISGTLRDFQAAFDSLPSDAPVCVCGTVSDGPDPCTVLVSGQFAALKALEQGQPFVTDFHSTPPGVQQQTSAD